MIQTAIIAFLIIGAMFFFTECGDDDMKEVTKVEVDKEGIPKYVTEKSNDKAYSDRDKEISIASYVESSKKAGSEIALIATEKKYSLATEGNSAGTGTSYETRDEEIGLASYGIKGKLDTDVSVAEAEVVVEEAEIEKNKIEEEQVSEEVITIPKSKVLDENSSGYNYSCRCCINY